MTIPTSSLRCPRRAPLAVSIAAFCALLPTGSFAVTLNYKAAGGNGNWGDTASWGGTTPTAYPGSGAGVDVVNIGDTLNFNNATITLQDTAGTAPFSPSIANLNLRLRNTAASNRTITINAGTGGAAGGVLYINNSIDVVRGDGANSAFINAPIDLTGNITMTGAQSSGTSLTSMGGVISGAFSITNTSSRITRFTQQNTFSGGFLTNGTVELGASSVAGSGVVTSGPLGTGTITLNGSTLRSRDGSARTLHNSVLLNGSMNFGTTSSVTSGNSTYTPNGTLTFTPSSAGTTFNINSATNGTIRTLTTNVGTTIGHGIGESGGGTGLGLTKAGTGNLTLSGAAGNTYTGATTVNAGTLILNKTAGVTAIAGNLAIGDGSGTDTVRADAANQFATTSAVTMNAAATPAFDLNGNNQNIGSLASANTAASVTLGAGILTTGSDDTSTTFAGVISGAGGLTKDGTGTFTLTGANTFSGATSVDDGTLEAGAAGALGSTSGVTVNTGGTLLLSGSGDRIGDSSAIDLAGGTFNTAGLSESVGALTLSVSSIINFASGEKALTFGDASVSWTGTLSIYNWTGTVAAAGTSGVDDQLLFTSLTNVSSHLGQISFYSDSGSTFLGLGVLISNEVVPVPEPSGVLVGLALVGLAGLREQRQIRTRLRVARKG